MLSASRLCHLSMCVALVSCLTLDTAPDFIRTTIGTPVNIPVLANDKYFNPPDICVEHIYPEPSAGRPVKFENVAAAAGITGAPQKIIRTSPNCIFDQYDEGLDRWNRGTYCIPEIMTGGAASGDFDNDNNIDIYFPRMDGMDSLYRNLGNGSFVDVAKEAGLGMTAHIRSNGAVLCDVDNDGDIDIYISTLGDTRLYMFINDGTGHFTEEAVARGVALERPAVEAGRGGLTASYSIAVGDFDADGDIDIFTTEWLPRLDSSADFIQHADEVTTCRLLQNDGAGVFTDVTVAMGIAVKPVGVGTRDQAADIWISAEYQERLVQFMIQNGANDEEAMAELARLHKHALAAYPSLKEKTRKKRRKQAADHSYVPIGTFEFSAKFADFNSDGYPDLLISGDFGTTQMYWNVKGEKFERGYLHPVWDISDNSMGQSVGDVDGDGKLDVLFTSMMLNERSRYQVDKFYPQAGITANFEGNHLYAYKGNKTFEDITDKAGIRDTGWSWGGILFDYDNDGWLDIVIANGMDDPETTDDDFRTNIPNAAFHNGGPTDNFAFSLTSAELGLDDRRDGRAVFELDYDNDGDLDLFVVNYADTPSLFRNDGGNSLKSLRINVREQSCAALGGRTAGCIPRFSTGAVVHLQATAHSTVVVREVGSSAAFMAHGESAVHFGLGAAVRRVHRVQIYWPWLNATRTLTNVPVNHLLTVFAPAVNHTTLFHDFGDDGSLTFDKCPQTLLSGVVGAAHGTAQMSEGRQYVIYSPSAGYIGNDTITYSVRLSDGTIVSNEVMIAVDAASASTHSESREGHTVPFLPAAKRAAHTAVVNDPLIRLAKPSYEAFDGPKIAPAGFPSTRRVSNVLMHQRGATRNRAGINDLFTYFTMFLAHDMEWSWDMSDLLNPSSERGDNIEIPRSDPWLDPQGKGSKLMPYHRSAHVITRSRSGATANQTWRQILNDVPPTLDLHTIFGYNSDTISQLWDRNISTVTLLATSEIQPSDAFYARFLPHPSGRWDVVNPFDKNPSSIYLSGDERVNMHPGLLSLHELFHIEQNRKALELLRSPLVLREVLDAVRHVHPSTNDSDALFKAAQVCTRAVYQKIVWYEYLPILLGPSEYAKLPSYNGHNPAADVSVSAEFATAAIQFWITLLGPRIPRLGQDWKSIPSGALSLKDAWFAPHYVALQSGSESVLRGAWKRPAQETDILLVDEVRNGFLGATSEGLDLGAIFVQRGRDAGLPSYAKLRNHLLGDIQAEGLTFGQLVAACRVPAHLVTQYTQQLEALYDKAEDVDLFVGGLLEQPVGDGVVGPLFAAIIREQMLRTRDGDASWFENEYSPDAGILKATGVQRVWLASFKTIVERSAGLVFPRETDTEVGPLGEQTTKAPSIFRAPSA